MIRQAKRKVVVVDQSKFGILANWLICRASQVDMIITDIDANDGISKASSRGHRRSPRVKDLAVVVVATAAQ